MSETKRSKGHRRKRNHISSKDMVNSNAVFSAYAKEVEKKRRIKYPKKNEIIYNN